MSRLTHIFKSQRGFTLIEVVLLMTLLGILGYAAVPQATNLAPLSLDSASRKLKTDIRYAQNMATTTGQAHGFLVTGTSTYKIYLVGDPATVLDDVTVTSPFTRAPMDEDLDIDFTGAQFSANYDVKFDANGRPTVGGGIPIVLTDSRTATTKTLNVTANSGFVSLQ